MTDDLNAETLQAALGGRPFRWFAQVSSTQDLARAWALDPRDPAPAGAVVIADEQTAGRGRQGRRWIAAPGEGLLFSVVLRPVLPAELLARCTMAAGLAVIEALDPLVGARTALKWPNDVLLDGLKVCGVLAEATWIDERLGAVIVGIGLNVRGALRNADLPFAAISLQEAFGRPVERLALLREVLARLDQRAAQVGQAAIVAAWRARLGTLGQRVNVYADPQALDRPSFSGLAQDVDATGALLVRLDSGEQRRVIAGDVTLAEA